MNIFGVAYGNSIVDSEAKIEVIIHSATEQQLAPIVVTAGYSNLFTEPGELDRVQLSRRGETFSTIIEVDTEATRVLITVYSPNDLENGPSAIGIITVIAEEITTIELSYDELKHYIFSDFISPNNLWTEEQAIQKILEYKSIDAVKLIDSQSDLSDWQHFGELINRIGSEQYSILTNALGSKPSAVATNTLLQLIAGNWILRANKQYEFLSGGDSMKQEIVFPAEFYHPLNKIDFSESFLDHSILLNPRYIIDKILESEIFDIEPIGETKIEKWQTDVKLSLNKVFDNPGPLLIDLLTAASYLNQLDENKIFSASQIINLDEWQNQALSGKLLKANADVTTILKEASGEVFDLSDQDFDLDEMLKKYSGKKLIIDLWNTWCGPCREARKMIESVSLPDDTVVIGIADTTSDKDEWLAIAGRQRGSQYLISEEAARKIREDYGFTGIPSFIVFSDDGRCVYKGIGTQALYQAFEIIK